MTEEFEAWILGWHPEAELAKTANGEYRNHTVRAQWAAFFGGYKRGYEDCFHDDGRVA